MPYASLEAKRIKWVSENRHPLNCASKVIPKYFINVFKANSSLFTLRFVSIPSVLFSSSSNCPSTTKLTWTYNKARARQFSYSLHHTLRQSHLAWCTPPLRLFPCSHLQTLSSAQRGRTWVSYTCCSSFDVPSSHCHSYKHKKKTTSFCTPAFTSKQYGQQALSHSACQDREFCPLFCHMQPVLFNSQAQS